MTTSTFSGDGAAVSPTLALTCSTVPGEAALMRVRSSAASATRELRARGGQRDLQPGRRRQPIGGERLAQRGARLIELLLGLVHGIARLVDVGIAAPGRCGAPCSARSSSSRLCTSCRSALATPSSAVLRSCAGLPAALGVVALALAHRRLGERGIDAADQLLVVEAHQQIAGRQPCR